MAEISQEFLTFARVFRALDSIDSGFELNLVKWRGPGRGRPVLRKFIF